MTYNSLTENEEHDILSQIYVWFPALLYGPVIPNCSGQLAELIVYIIPPEWICILGRELGPSGVSPNQIPQWKLAFSPLKHV